MNPTQPSRRRRLPAWLMVRLLPMSLSLLACGGGFHTPAQDATVGVVAKAEITSEIGEVTDFFSPPSCHTKPRTSRNTRPAVARCSSRNVSSTRPALQSISSTQS